MAEQREQLLRKLPSVDSVVNDPALQQCEKIPSVVKTMAAREAIEELRQELLEGKSTDTDIRRRAVEKTKKYIDSVMHTYYRRVINATGIILHTGLGRAALPAAAIEQLQKELAGYSLLQLDRKSGKRSRRDVRIELLLKQLTGAEAATVVNNNAAATAIVLNTVAKDREVIVSRGQLVEIGGSFRLPDVMAFSGAKLVEVGSTNKTHPSDYINAITENTAAILRVHPSNYKIQGFSSEVSLEGLVDIAHKHNLVMIDDVGAGALIDFSRFGFEHEPTLIESIKKGADIVTSSADKLIGSCQGGIILGRAELIDKVRKNQFARIVRIDKMTLAALEATLMLFLDENSALEKVPTLAMLMRDIAEIKAQAERMTTELEPVIAPSKVAVKDGFSQMGSGSLPTQNLATFLVAIEPDKISVQELASRLRVNEPAIFTRVQQEQVLIDPRTLLEGQEKIVVTALQEILGHK